MSDPETSPFAGATSTGVDPRLSALLCYTAWWVSGIVFLIIEHQHRAVRFHAAQSLVVFGGLSLVIGLLSGLSIAMLMVSAAAFQAARLLVYLVWMATVGLWLLVMLRTYQGETWRVPIASDLADRIADR